MKGDRKEKMREEKIKRRNLKERGITLVALVVTIIILLILAGVTLNIALSENGLFQRAKGTAKRYENASENETEILDNLDKTLAELSEQTPPTGETGGTGSSEVADNLKKYQGKYVDIGLDVTGSTATTDDWELFYATKDRIFLIAADYVPVTKLTEWGIMGSSSTSTTLYNNGFRSDGSYNVYWSSPQFLTLPTDSNFLSEVMHTRYTLNPSTSNINQKAVSQLLNKEAWSVIIDKASTDKKQYLDYAIGGPTLEMWCAAWNEAVGTENATFKQIQADQTNGNGYYVGCKATGETQQTLLYMNGTTNTLGSNLTTLGNDYKTFFPHVAEYNSCYGYWLASPSAYFADRLVFVAYDGNVYISFYSDSYYGVRPVVSLQSGVQIVEREGADNIYDVTK